MVQGEHIIVCKTQTLGTHTTCILALGGYAYPRVPRCTCTAESHLTEHNNHHEFNPHQVQFMSVEHTIAKVC